MPNMFRLTFCMLLLTGVLGCNNTENSRSAHTAGVRDPHSLSNADSILLEHLDLDIRVDFENRIIAGAATWQFRNIFRLPELWLDTYELQIDSVLTDGIRRDFTTDSPDPVLGTRLRIPLSASTEEVRIFYRTGSAATALKWLDPEQTAGKKHPFLYTQSQAIHARSWVPCADGPGFRYTYNARVQVPSGLLALMSATNPRQINDSGIYYFSMRRPVPAYLMALAAGDISFRPIDNRTGVYAEPSLLEKAYYELAETGLMLQQAEQLYGPYRWDRFDVLILPPSFPFGGMENPMLTFATPTILAGDRSLTNLIAHELAHSWSGNLVTNASWEDIWLNEGFTVYFERRITEQMAGTSYTDMLWELGYQDLEHTIKEMGASHRNTWLHQDLKNTDAGDGLTDIPYEKGSLFLLLLERETGRERFDSFLRNYFEAHAFRSVHTPGFLEYLDKNLIGKDDSLRNRLQINAWVYGPGIPSNAPRTGRERFERVDSVRRAFLSGTMPEKLPTGAWTTHEWLHFLRGIPSPATRMQMETLDRAFDFTRSGNSEIASLWFIMSIRAGYEEAYPEMDSFLSSVGRKKFLDPMYGEMIRSGKQDMADSIYRKYRSRYHPITRSGLDKICSVPN